VGLVNLFGLPQWVSFWKEFIEIVIISLCFVESFKSYKNTRSSTKIYSLLPFYLLLVATIFSLWSSFIFNNISLKIYLIGFRFELLWVWFFVAIYTWLEVAKPNTTILKKYLTKSVALGFVLVSVVSLASIFFGQQNVLPKLGFTDNIGLTSPQVCHTIDQTTDNCSLSGTFGNPNHFAGYLILVLPFLLVLALDNRRKKSFSIYTLLLLFWVIFFCLSLARFAWIGLFLAIILYLIYAFIAISIQKYFVLESSKTKVKSIIFVIISVLVFVMPLILSSLFFKIPDQDLYKVPAFIGKPSSTAGHSKSVLTSVDLLKNNHLEVLTGFGLGAAGPAAKIDYYDIFSQRIITENNMVAIKNRIQNDRLPIPESWFMQLWLNGGIFYLILISIVILCPLWYFLVLGMDTKFSDPTFFYINVCFLTIILGNLSLHLWENQTVAIYYTLLFLLGKLKYDSEKQ
jgi:hypothetical protein